MPTYKRTATLLYALLGAFSLIVVDFRYLLLPTAYVSLSLFVGGLICFPRLEGAFAIPWPAPAQETDYGSIVIIEDTRCPRREYDQELIVMLSTRRLPELAATVVLAAATAYFILAGKASLAPPLIKEWGVGGFFGLEFVGFAGLAVLLVNVQWFSERRFLRNSYWALCDISARDPGFFRTGITYQFLDHQQQRRGGRGPQWGHPRDNAAIVFYHPDDPDKNAVHGALMFHKLRIHLIPKFSPTDQ